MFVHIFLYRQLDQLALNLVSIDADSVVSDV